MIRWQSICLVSSLVLAGLLAASLMSLSTSVARSPTVAQDTTIGLWHGYADDKEVFFQRLVDEFEAAHPTITVQLDQHRPSLVLFDDVLDTLKSGGERPNLIFAYPNQMWNYARFDGVRFLDDLVVDHDLGLDTADFYSGALNENRLPEYDYQLGGLPVGHSAGEMLFYNADLLLGAGITVPQTWDQFYTACMTLTTDAISGTILRTNNTHFLSILWSRGGQPYSEDLKRAAFNQAPGIHSLSLYRRLLDEGLARMEEYKYEDTQAFAAGQAAFIINGSTTIPFVRDAVDQAGVVQQWGVAPLPSDPGKEVVMDIGRSLVMLRGTSDEEAASWRFMRWFSQREQDARFSARMGYYPVRISSTTHPSTTQVLADSPQYALALNHLEQYGREQQVLLALIEIYGEMTAAVDAVLYANEPVTATLNDAAAQVDAILALTGPDATTITPAGGELAYTNSQGLAATTVFPPGALPVTTTVAYVPLNDLPSEGLAFALVPNMALSQPATVSIEYRDEDVARMDEEALRLYNYDWAARAYVDASPCGGYQRDPENNRLSAVVCHFSDHALTDYAYSVYLPLVLR